MWLINTPSLQLEYFVEGAAQVPHYAILSHRWGKDELSFQEVQTADPIARTTKGKVWEACQQAIKDRYEYIWIDTCCIDKTSTSELSEAINSMYGYYQNARECYVYLNDVQVPKGSDIRSADGIIAAQHLLSKCEWVRRGWTLQELLAPKHVSFFDRDWVRIGDKDHLQGVLEKITGIDRR